MLTTLSEPTLALLIGMAGGLVLGLAARLGRFCTLGAIEDALYAQRYDRLAMWGVAIGTAIIGTQFAVAFGALDPRDTLYIATSGAVVAAIVGGLIFGYGMALCGNCGYGALARLGGGDLRSMVIVLVMGLGAYITLSGPLALPRMALFGTPDPTAALTGPAQTLALILPLHAAIIGIALGALILALGLWPLAKSKAHAAAFWGICVGGAIVSGWTGTAWVARTGFDDLPVVSHTFSAPVGETLLYAMTSTGNSLSFGIGSVAGVLIGAFAGSLLKGHFRWEACDDPRELKRQILGAFIMGMGAVIATGCSIGQGITGLSLLTWTAPLTLISTFVGSAAGLKILIGGYQNI